MVGRAGSVGVAGDDSCMSHVHGGAHLDTNEPDDIQEFIQNLMSGPVMLPKYTAAELVLIPADRYPFKLFAVTDGAGNRWAAMSNGTTWRYLDGTAV